MSNISPALAFFIGTVLECVLYGVFVPLFISACYVQRKKFSRGQGVNPVMTFSSVFFWFTITTGCVLSLFRTIRATFHNPSGVTVDQYRGPPYPAEEIVRWGIFQFQIVVADIIMVYRMYHVYDRNPFVCVIPSITTAALFAVGCGLTNQLRDLTTSANRKALDKWSSACFCLTIFNSLFTTIAISFRLWSVHREVSHANIYVKDSIIFRTMRVLIESAALWTAFVAMDFFAFLAKSNLVFTFLAMTGPTVGISFCLIIVRLGDVLAGVRDETWHVSIPAPTQRTPTSEQLAISLPRVKTQQDVYFGGSEESPVDTLEFQEQGHAHYSSDLSKIVPTYPGPLTPPETVPEH